MSHYESSRSIAGRGSGFDTVGGEFFFFCICSFIYLLIYLSVFIIMFFFGIFFWLGSRLVPRVIASPFDHPRLLSLSLSSFLYFLFATPHVFLHLTIDTPIIPFSSIISLITICLASSEVTPGPFHSVARVAARPGHGVEPRLPDALLL